MECNPDWKNIAGLFPISQQILGVYEIGKGFYEIVSIICEAVGSTFKELRETYFSKEVDKCSKLDNHHFVPVNFTPEMKRNAMSYEPNFRLDEDSDAEDSEPVGARGDNPELTRLVGSGKAIYRNNCVIFHCDPNAPLMTREEKDAAEDSVEPFIGIFEESEILTHTPSTWEKLKEPITKVGVGILYFTPVVGTIYSAIQLVKQLCNNDISRRDPIN